jgi:hypothetical protein
MPPADQGAPEPAVNERVGLLAELPNRREGLCGSKRVRLNLLGVG